MRRIALLFGLLIGLNCWAQYSLPIMGSPVAPSGGASTIVCVQGGPGCTNTTSTGAGISFGNPLTFTFPANVTAGHTVVVIWTANGAPSSVTGGTDTLTTTSYQYATSGQYIGFSYICSSAGGYSSVSINFGASKYAYGQALELSGTKSTGCLDTAVSNSGTASANPSPGTLTPAQSGEAFFAVSWNSSSAATLNWTGATALFDSNANNVADGAYLITTTSTAQTPAWTLGASNWVAVVAAFEHN